jgi:hypothetical protein
MDRQDTRRHTGGAAGLALLESGLTRPVMGRAERARLGMREGRSGIEPGLLLQMDHAWQGEVDVGECLDTLWRVDPADASTWAREWTRTAERIREVAQHAEAKGRWISAGEAWLRTSAYCRAALYCYPGPRAPEVTRLARQVLVGFTRALRLLALPAQPVSIPYEHTTLPGYFFRSPAARGLAPVLIVHPGRDAWAEDCKSLAEGSLKRGYHCLLFDGPGQGKALRLQGLPFRPDWEGVVAPVVDWVLGQRGVDPARIALVGFGMGQSLAPRLALFEKRVKLCLASPGASSWAELAYELTMGAQAHRFEHGRRLCDALRGQPRAHTGQSPSGSQHLFSWLDECL